MGIHNSRSELELTTNILLQTHAAICMFQHDQGRLPESLDELVPGYLGSPAVDPNSVPLRYRLEGKNMASRGFVLYGVGWDGRDDGGRFTTYNRFFGTLAGSKWSSESLRPNPISYDMDLGMFNREEMVDDPPVLDDIASPPVDEEPKREAVETKSEAG
jgi:hypothetical protein